MKKLYILFCLVLVIVLASCEQSEATFNDGGKNINNGELTAPNESSFLGSDISNQPYTIISDMIKQKNQELNNLEFSIIGEDNSYVINFKEINFSLDEAQIIGNIKKGIDNNLSYTYDKEKLDNIILGICESENIEAVNASIKFEDEKLKIINGVNGVIVSKDDLYNDLINVFELNVTSVDLVYIESSPKYTEADFADFVEIGKYETKYKTYDTNRNINLAEASNRINNSVLYPNETFSTNNHYGPTTIENGYAVANVIVNNELVDGLGGGVCQISSTLYNAVLLSELKIEERKNHSLPVSYVPLGLDATLATPYIDFKFTNNHDTPILVTAYIKDGIANVTIYGKESRDQDRTLKFRSITVGSTQAGEVFEDDDTLYIGQEVVSVKPLNGLVVETYKDVYKNDKLVETIYIGKSNYTKRDAVIKVGTKEPENIPDVEVEVKPPIEEDTSKDIDNEPEKNPEETQENKPQTENEDIVEIPEFTEQ